LKYQKSVPLYLRKAALGLVSIVAVWLLFLGYTIFSFPVAKSIEGADAIVVLGAGVSGNKPSPVFEERLNHAISLFQTGNARKLIFTGGYGNQVPGTNAGEQAHGNAESLVARQYAISQGIRPKDILIETQSHTTRQNLLEAQKILVREGLNHCIIVSDPMHMTRAMMMAEDLGIDATAAATPTSRFRTMKTKIPFLIREMYFYHHYLIFGD
jgi:uncharacterized SAM-binding protein YcdF (DUF218 family)